MAHLLADALVFRRTRSIVHDLDPRNRLILALGLFVFSLVYREIVEVIVLYLLVIVISAIAKILRRVLRLQMIAAMLASFILAVNIVVGYDLVYSIALSVRFVIIVSSTSIFFLTTTPDELEAIMRWLKIPRSIVFTFTASIRFIPVLMLDLTQIVDAQRSRGLEIEKGNFIKRIRNLVPILVPLIVSALVRSSELAEALETRGFGATTKPTSTYELRFKGVDYVSSVLIAGLFVLLALLYVL